MRGLRVEATGALALVQDLGRPGLAGVGVGRSGAADRASLRLANRLVGNPEHAAGIEVTLGGLEVEVGEEPLLGVVTGAPVEVHVDGRAEGYYAVWRAAPGTRIRLGRPTVGLRSYLCLRGGVEAAVVLDSRSRDVLAELGPAPLAPGDLLPVGRADGALPDVDAVAPPAWTSAGASADPAPTTVVLRAVRGPRDAWVRDVDVLAEETWQVSDRCNRVGVRLEPAERWSSEEADDPALGPAEEHAGQQLPSEGAWRGGVQVPPGGQPVLFLADHPVTGGYPVVAVVVDADVDRAAQLRPGDRVRLRWVDPS